MFNHPKHYAPQLRVYLLVNTHYSAFLAPPPHSAEVMLLDYPLSELVRGVFYGGKDEAVHEAVDVYNGGLFDEYLGELLVPNND